MKDQFIFIIILLISFASQRNALGEGIVNDPYSVVQGENFEAASGKSVAIETCGDAKGGRWVRLGMSGDWIRYSKMKFDKGVLSVSVIGGTMENEPASRNVEIWIDGVSAPGGTMVVNLPLPLSEGLRPTRVTRKIAGTLDGTHDVT
ncbi:MAG TPA: carbohydrate-binding protein [Bacteroidales bacterium]